MVGNMVGNMVGTIQVALPFFPQVSVEDDDKIISPVVFLNSSCSVSAPIFSINEPLSHNIYR